MTILLLRRKLRYSFYRTRLVRLVVSSSLKNLLLKGAPLPCDGNIGNPYDPCEPIIYSSVVTTYNGSTSSNPPTETTSYYYDDYNPPGSQQSQWKLSLSGNYHHLLEETITGSNTNENSASATINKLWTYTVTDSGYNLSGWYFYDVNKIAHSEIDDVGNPIRKWDCQAFTYDEGSGSPTPEAGWPTTTSTYTSANCNPGNFTTPFTTSYTGYDALGDVVATVDPLAQANQSFYGGTGISGKNGCSLTTAPTFMSTAWSKNRYTTCLTYDQAYNALPTSTTNAFSQTTSTSYDAQMGELPKAVTDPNGQATSYTYSYDQSGNRTMQITKPNETQYSYTSQSVTKSSCAGSIPTGATTPCFEIDTNEAEYPTAVTETFYDGLGRQVETRAPGPTSGDDTIQFTVYNDQAQTSFTSVPFEVTAGSGWVDPATAKDKNGTTPAGTMTYYDALDRVIAVDDPIFNPPSVPGIWCSAINAYATACTVYKLDSPQGSSTLYDTEKDIDPNNHVTETLTDAMGRIADTQEYSGTNGNGLTAIQQISYQYDALDQPVQVTTIDLAPQNGQTTSSVTTTMSYDDLGRLTQLVDPDRGTHTYTYDPDGSVLNDTSGSRTIGYNDDLLGRTGCVQDGTAVSDADGSCTSGTNPLVQYTYDTTEIGTQGSNDFSVGRLTKSQSFTYYPEGGTTQSTEKYQYDQRGRVTTEQLKLNLPNSWNLTLPTYQLSEQYTDADQPLTTQTSTINGQGQNTPQYTETDVYDSTLGVLTGQGNTISPTNADLASITYNVNALPSKLSFQTSTGGNLASEQFSYDGDLRPTEEAATWQNGSGQSGTFFDNAQGYDAASNIDTVTTTISQPNGQSGSSSETQNFCYDEQNRLVWAGNSGTQPAPGNGTCGSGTLANNFPGASYATSFSYTYLGQLWQGPLNGTGSSQQYLYCNSQPHQVSDIVPAGQGYTCNNLPKNIPYAVSYDAWGNVTSRSYNTQTATLSYNKLDEMVEWQVPNTNQAWYAYNASGERTLERSAIGSTTTETVYAFGMEEYSYDSSGNQTSSTHYYSLAGHLIGEAQTSGSSTTTNFFLTDALGSVLAVISNTESSAALLSNQVFAPYGTLLSHNGNSISQYTNKGFTGQYNDPTSGLDYYVSRYYDAVSGVLLSADKTLGNASGMNPYSYVGNNPETNNDPTGQAYIPPGGGGGGGNNNNGNGSGSGGGGVGGGGGGYGVGGSGMGDPGSGGHEGGGCAWWNPSCDVQQIWHTFTTGTQTVEHDESNGIHFLQQQEQELIQDGVKLGIKIIVALVAAAIAIGTFLFGLIRSGSSGRFWSIKTQRQNAYQLAQNIDKHRSENDNDYRTTFAQGCIGIGGPSCSVKSRIVFGTGQDNNTNHAEKQIFYWARSQIATMYQDLPKGTVINVLIYVQLKPCQAWCQGEIKQWAQELQDAAPSGVIVRLWVWYQPGFDVDHPLDNPVESPSQIAPFIYIK